MDKSALLQRFFSLLMPEDQAEAIVGDLLELRPTRGRTWFWMQSGRIWCRFAGSKLAVAPLRSLVLALVGLLVYSAAYAAMFQFVSFTDYAEYIEPGNPLASISMFPAVVWFQLTMLVAAASFASGLVLGGFSSRQSMNAVMPLLAVFAVYWAVWPVIGTLVLSLRWYFVVGGIIGFPFFAFGPMLAGGAISAVAFRTR